MLFSLLIMKWLLRLLKERQTWLGKSITLIIHELNWPYGSKTSINCSQKPLRKTVSPSSTPRKRMSPYIMWFLCQVVTGHVLSQYFLWKEGSYRTSVVTPPACLWVHVWALNPTPLVGGRGPQHPASGTQHPAGLTWQYPALYSRTYNQSICLLLQTPGVTPGVQILSHFSSLSLHLGDLPDCLVFLDLWPRSGVAKLQFFLEWVRTVDQGGSGFVTCRQCPLAKSASLASMFCLLLTISHHHQTPNATS